MKKTFFLGVRNWIYILMGAMFLLNGIITYFKDDPGTFGYVLMVLNLSVGTYAFFYGIILTFYLMGLSPKVVVANEGVLLKAKAFASGKKIPWQTIQSITFHSYQLDFKLETEPPATTHQLEYQTSPLWIRDILVGQE